MKIAFGTNRLVLVFDEFVVKIPWRVRGIFANYDEYLNSIGNQFVAHTRRFGPINIQQRLDDITIFPLDVDVDSLPRPIRRLVRYRLHNRIQIGRDRHTKLWKYFDYEDVKYRQK